MGTDDADGALTIDGHRFWCCTAIGCDSIASIVVQSGTDAPYAYCGLHWDELRRPFGHGNALYVPIGQTASTRIARHPPSAS